VLAQAAPFAQGGAVNLLSFVHPGLLAGLAVAALPAAIHLMGRRHAPVVAFAAFDFLQAINHQQAFRERLRQWLLLVLRTLALLAFVLALAQPQPQHPAGMVTEGARRVAFVVDTSASMAYVIDSKSLLVRATAQALDVLSQLAPGDSVSLVTAGDGGGSHNLAPTLDHAAVRAALAAVAQLKPAGVADMGGALAQAWQQLAPGPEATPSQAEAIFVFGDLARHSFANLRPLSPGGRPQLHLLDAAARRGSTALANVAIVGAEVRGAAPGAPRGERNIVVHLQNFGSQATGARPIVLCVDGEPVLRATIDIGAQSSADKVLTHTFAKPGLVHLTIRLGPDAADGYGDDDVWRGQAEIMPNVTVLAVNGEPRATAFADEIYFLERALAAVPQGEAPIDVQSCAAEALVARLGGAVRPDVVVLAHLMPLDTVQVQALLAFVGAGGGLLMTVGLHTDFEAANGQLKNLLPHPLRDLSRVADPGTAARALGVGQFDWTHPVLQDLGTGAEESLRQSRTTQYFNLDVGAAAAARTLLAFDNGAPALVEHRSSIGRIFLWSTSIDVDLSDLPLRTAFVPLMQRSVRYLAGALSQPTATSSRVPALVTLAVPTQATAVALTSPAGHRYEVTRDSSAGSALVKLGPFDEVGFYAGSVRARGTWALNADLDVAVNARLDESDFQPVAVAAVATALGVDGGGNAAPVGTGFSGFAAAAGPNWTAPLLAALLLLAAAEGFVAARG
jgi:hypothetical protein